MVQEPATASQPRAIATDDAPRAIGPYSQAVSCAGARGLLFVSGQLPIPAHPANGDPPPGVEAQFRVALANALAVVRAGGGALTDVVKATVYLTDLSHYDQFNRVYGELFREWRPARSVVQVAGLPRGACIEVELIATLSDAAAPGGGLRSGGEGSVVDPGDGAAKGGVPGRER